ncbi:MAG: glycosyltransferase family A protein [Eubacteriales bacterium]|nr:glycosyltransferase family A protein [Eubacteriales bacterium]
MLFSVLIPLYNAEKYIGECIDSVLAQTYKDFEIVIVDDGSTDRSSEIADKYAKDYSDNIRVKHKEKTGVVLTRRRLLQEAKGEYIVWIDSDDIYKPDYLSDLSEEINKNQPDVIISNYEFLDDSKKVVCSLDLPDKSIIQKDDKHIIFEKMLLGRNMNELVTKCIRREIIDINVDYSGFMHVRMGDDLFCLLPIFDVAERIEYLDRSYYLYRVVTSSITHTETYSRYYSYRTIFERELYYLSKWNFTPEETAKVKDKFANRIVDSLVSCANSKNKKLKDFIEFANDVMKDEEAKPIYSDSERKLPSKPYQRFYNLFIKKRYKTLYFSIKLISTISKIKH